MTITLSHRNALTLSFLAGAGALAGACAFTWAKYRMSALKRSHAPAAAFAGTGAHLNSFVHTRDAGPDHIRDEYGEDWDQLDQASDESFPASDPPVHNNFSSPQPIDYSEPNGAAVPVKAG